MPAAPPAAPASFAQRLSQGVSFWLMSHMELMFRIARTVAPILRVTVKGRRYALVTRFDDVAEVMSLPNVFDVTYAPKIRVLMDGGNIFLGMKDEEPATRDRATMRVAMPRGEGATRVGPESGRLAEAAVAAAGGRLDVVKTLTQEVTTRFFGAYFGTPATDVAAFSDRAQLLFQFMFGDLNDDAALRARVDPAAAAMRDHVEQAIAARKKDRGRRDDVLERLLVLQDQALPGTTDEDIRNNLIGFIVGGLPQPPMVLPQLIDQLLDRPAELAAASAAARDGDDALLSRYLFEALRFNPLTPGLFRDTVEDYRLAAGTWRARTIVAGTRVFAATRSAMFDGRRVPRPAAFRTDRPDYSYMHFGHGLHECFGLYMNRAMIPAMAKPLLRRRGLRRAPGEAGRLKAEGLFPTSLIVEFDPV